MRQYRGNTAESRRLERRERLLAAARKVFGEQGFHSAKVRAICEEAGLTERYFYESFANSEALFIAMHKATSERIISIIANAADTCTDKPEAKVRAMLLAYFEDIVADPVAARLFAIDAGYISAAAKEVCSNWRQRFGSLVAQTLNGRASAGSPLVRSGAVLAVLSIGVEWMESGFSTPIGAIVDAASLFTSVLKGH
ncbi:TetR/AcrR family transcriptional regulator [Caballeronia sp. LZ001]|uniref:TetR/AcrR family transcriptional regulator n=1 Tax=Caballeronia sp. LZ001 TaxID=3038553 RepID=UPI002858F3BA|nr:TetR/AcrR family transcriptional regulator [Caballeronia sp. LZ001]MDR5804754.1 TetR/AcrR family transcriptional regulator [Caballeronia sp. LZ001]